jgi:uncharacterized coiled-coil protein SlyX
MVSDQNKKLFGLSKRKKTTLDKLTVKVTTAQTDAEKQEVIVVSLTEKLNRVQGMMAAADANRTTALNNLNNAKIIVDMSLDLCKNAAIAHTQAIVANADTKAFATGMSLLTDKLIYSAELINKLANLIIRKKAMNPLISDELVAIIGTVGMDANNAVALTLVALKSTMEAQSSNIQSAPAGKWVFVEVKQLYQTLTGMDENGKPLAKKSNPLIALLTEAFFEAQTKYEEMETAVKCSTIELNSAITLLAKKKVALMSFLSGLAAANAAALAG